MAVRCGGGVVVVRGAGSAVRTTIRESDEERSSKDKDNVDTAGFDPHLP